MSEYPIVAIQSRQQGKSQIVALAIRAQAYPTGLPNINVVLATGLKLVRWDKDTGEVRTIEYEPNPVWIKEGVKCYVK